MPITDPFAEIKHAEQLADGLHDDISFPLYQAQRAMNASTLKYASVSMAHVKAAFDGRIVGTDSQARKFGRMVHLRLLEPEKYRQADIATQCCAVLKSGERKGERCGVASQCVIDADWYCGRHAPATAYYPKDFVTEKQAADIEQMAMAVAGRFDITTHGTEVTAIATIDGVRCKGRFDVLESTSTVRRITDIKKCQVGECTIDACEKSILSYGWHIQSALYSRLAKELTGFTHDFRWLFIEDSEPYSVVEMEADDETINIGRSEVTLALRRWRECVESGKYPGPVSRPGGLPLWYRERWADDNFKVTA